jgi:hypothetical protein
LVSQKLRKRIWESEIEMLRRPGPQACENERSAHHAGPGIIQTDGRSRSQVCEQLEVEPIRAQRTINYNVARRTEIAESPVCPQCEVSGCECRTLFPGEACGTDQATRKP